MAGRITFTNLPVLIINKSNEHDKIDRSFEEWLLTRVQGFFEGTTVPFTYGGTFLVRAAAFLNAGGYPDLKKQTEVAEDLKLGQKLAALYGKKNGGIVRSGGRAEFSNRRENKVRKAAEEKAEKALKSEYEKRIRYAQRESQAILLQAKFEQQVKAAGQKAVNQMVRNFFKGLFQHVRGVEHIKAPAEYAEFQTVAT